jgi:hypothetical protein
MQTNIQLLDFVLFLSLVIACSTPKNNTRHVHSPTIDARTIYYFEMDHNRIPLRTWYIVVQAKPWHFFFKAQLYRITQSSPKHMFLLLVTAMLILPEWKRRTTTASPCCLLLFFLRLLYSLEYEMGLLSDAIPRSELRPDYVKAFGFCPGTPCWSP